MSIKAVLFDVGETLWHSQVPPGAAELQRISACRVRAVMQAEGLDGVAPEQVAACGFKTVDEAIRTAREGSRREPDYPTLARDAFAKLGLGVTVAQAAALIDAAYVSGPEGGKVAAEDARRTLDGLRRRGFRLATVTNRAFGGRRFRSDLEQAGLDVGWDAQSVSVEVGYLKPRPEIFQHALRALGLRPAQALMVGNSLYEDVAGAQALGIRAVWVRSVPDAEGVIPDHTVDRVSGLLSLPALGKADG